MTVFGRVVVVVSMATVVSLASTSGLAGAAAKVVSTSPVSASVLPFYLDLGASMSVGLQPTLTAPKGERTTEGYANDLLAYESSHGIHLQMTQLGCPSETTKSMIDGGDQCYRLHDTQLREAIYFLRTHYGDSGIVTLDMGFNDIRPCLANNLVNNTCVRAQIKGLKARLQVILDELVNAAGPNVTVVGLGHYDPYLAAATQGPAGQVFADQSDEAMDRLNTAMLSVYGTDGVAMASVGDAFDSSNVEPVNVAGFGVVPDNVAEVCALTWMCQVAPYGPNIHPDNAGYAAIAASIESVLKSPW